MLSSPWVWATISGADCDRQALLDGVTLRRLQSPFPLSKVFLGSGDLSAGFPQLFQRCSSFQHLWPGPAADLLLPELTSSSCSRLCRRGSLVGPELRGGVSLLIGVGRGPSQSLQGDPAPLQGLQLLPHGASSSSPNPSTNAFIRCPLEEWTHCQHGFLWWEIA